MNFLDFNKNSFNVDNIVTRCSDFWNKHYRLAFFIFSIVVLSLGIYFWYQSLYRSEWSDEEKNQYKKSQNSEVDLKKQEFKMVVEEIERRGNIFKEAPSAAKNIFESYAASQKSANPSANENISTP